jgi:hypothetical protein
LALIKIVKSNGSGFPIPAIPSRYNDVEGAGAPVNVLEGVYEDGGQFSIDIGIQFGIAAGEEITYSDVPVTSIVNNNAPSGISIRKNGDKIRISGSPTRVFTDSFYQFLMKDKTLKVLPNDTTEPILAVVRWSPPSTKILYDVPYVITFKYMNNLNQEEQETITILQDVYWNYIPALQGFAAALAKGTL